MSDSFTVSFKLSNREVAHYLCAAFEGDMTRHWANVVSRQRPPKPVSWMEEGGKPHQLYDWPLTEGGNVVLAESDGTEHVLDRESIQRGIDLMCHAKPLIFARLVHNEYDAVDADVFLQYCCLSGIVYG